MLVEVVEQKSWAFERPAVVQFLKTHIESDRTVAVAHALCKLHQRDENFGVEKKWPRNLDLDDDR